MYYAVCQGTRTPTVGLLTIMVQTLDLFQKKQITEELDRLLRSGENESQHALAGWAQAKFRLPHAPEKAVMSGIL